MAVDLANATIVRFSKNYVSNFKDNFNEFSCNVISNMDIDFDIEWNEFEVNSNTHNYVSHTYKQNTTTVPNHSYIDACNMTTTELIYINQIFTIELSSKVLRLDDITKKSSLYHIMYLYSLYDLYKAQYGDTYCYKNQNSKFDVNIILKTVYIDKVTNNVVFKFEYNCNRSIMLCNKKEDLANEIKNIRKYIIQNKFLSIFLHNLKQVLLTTQHRSDIAHYYIDDNIDMYKDINIKYKLIVLQDL